MSWVKKRGQSTNPTAQVPQVPMYNPNQHSNQENQWQQQYGQPPKQDWQQPYSQNPQYYYQNNTYQQQPQQPYGNQQYNQQYTQNNLYEAPTSQSEDTWGSNWGWGDEDNSNTQAPNIADSFAKDEAWNWSLDTKPEQETGDHKRNKLETPQWSVESQMSQESSDDVLQTSESDKSRMLSRSSTVSHSPISGQEVAENKEILGGQQQDDKKSFARNKFRATPSFQPQTVNLETPPDNSEQPDPIPTPKISWPENNEAPINDRNQYLETAQLSDVDLNNFAAAPETTQDDTLPPPGLRRMIPGQTIEPPEGLHRMIPGESSSPETSLRPNEPEVRRSETIGADTSPDPAQNQQRRDSIEGDVGELVTSVRNLTVGEQEETNESGGRRHSRQESSESEREVRPKSPRRGDRRREKEGERSRGRYSPDDYRRRKYKDRRYEEESDYYSDKEKDRDRRHERDYDRKYNSLRKEKDKDRRRRDDRRDYDRGRYYGRYEEEFENESRSRASSRSDSMHESYRERDRGHDRRERRHREKDRHKRHRDPFNPYNPAFGYDIYSQYYQQYQYYENLRKTNPQAYAQLYRKYYQDTTGEASYGPEDRASVHSGRSSANDELTKDSFARTLDQTDNSLNYEESNLTAQRLTPAKFSTAHVKASITSGKMIKILPHYPLDGQTPTVELLSLENYLYNDEDYLELKRFPGPLVKGTTHKKTIIEYCENKIKNAVFNHSISDKESYILMWELLILLIRQNGMVVGADIAELLLKNRSLDVAQRPPSVISSVGSNIPEGETSEPITTLKEEEITNKFRDYLLYGSVKEALEWAMKNGLWGHALFLASKLDKRTYANVLMRFANGLAMNDPLQTLYQLLSGRTPAAVTCVADEKWGDWRPHLAMILSNSTQRPEVNCKAITVLGDTLMGRGSLYAAQFCYLMAEVGFGNYGCAESKLVLLGSNHNNNFVSFATNEAIHMTEIYEYARSLNDDDFSLVNFQRFKYLLSTRLADVGLLEKSLSYLEKIANFIVKNPTKIESDLINNVSKLADRLKYYDPVGDGEGDFDTSRLDNSWLEDLTRVQNEINTGAGSTLPTQEDQIYTQNQDVWSQQYDYQQQQQWNPEPISLEPQPKIPETESFQNNYQEQQQFWAGQQQWSGGDQQQQYQENIDQNYYGSAQPEEIPKPQISLPNTKETPQTEPKKEVVKPKPVEPVQDKQSGWFGGIFNKLSLKPKNQMKLPDDKNPTILWDSEKKRWVNTDEDNGDGANDFKPPPKMTEAPVFVPAPTQPSQENGISKANMFKMAKNRNIKKSYIDVFNPNAKSGQPAVPPAPLGGAPTQPQPPMNFFIPQPVNDPNAPTDFLTPAPPLQFNENTQMAQ